KEIVAYFRMLDPTIRQRLTPVKYFSYDIVNPPDPLSVAESFTFEQDLIHVIGIIDNEGRMFVVRIRDPYEFTRSKEIESATQVSEFANKARCSYDLRSGATEYFNLDEEQ
ncbi:MAG: hypothetical protein WAT74_02385, partial [Flavobacteriales bacterium]